MNRILRVACLLAAGICVGPAADTELGKSGSAATNKLECFSANAATGASKAVRVAEGALIFTGQLLPTVESSSLDSADAITNQTAEVLAKMGRLLSETGARLNGVAKLNVYLARESLRPAVERILAATFAGSAKPAVCFVVSRLPAAGSQVALDAVAVSEKSATQVEYLRSSTNAAGIAFAQAALLPAGPKVFVSGMADGGPLPLATRKTLEKLLAAIGHLGLGRGHIVQLKAFLQPMDSSDLVSKVIAEFFGGQPPPTVLVEWISPRPNPPIEIGLVAAGRESATAASDTVSFLTPPETTSTKVYSRVARVDRGRMLFISGLVGGEGPGEAQTRDIFKALGGILDQTGSDFQHLVKATYYVTDDDATKALNDIRPEYFDPTRPPAASKAKVTSVGFPGRTMSVDMIAVEK